MPVAIITGAASGIGLALSRQFTEQGWNVTLADVDVLGGQRAAEQLGDQAFFHKTDVSNWDDVASLYKKTIEKFGRIDYVAANAGVADFQSLYEKNEGEPQKPNLRTIDIDLNGQIYCLYLAAHYFRQNGGDGGTIVFTSSNAGLYKLPTNPQYAAAKYGIIGLVRSVAPVFQKENIRVNCICPAFVPTGLAPEFLLKVMPSEHITPMSTIMRAFDNFAKDSSLVGKVAECSQGNIFYREQVEYCDESSRWHGEESSKLWEGAYN
ncbi:unnamed protein product [Clonostachys byssicola]|uniref:15-hydroxyprostaglandin dehydrogenase n=1 Tax=Clonostachys byssicola TaxID=160290 RepID=A0A9N9Y1L6_9HYPO|nr:unnamed protein product [Clonostachys byssicola]